jgi:hypothetical protein
MLASIASYVWPFSDLIVMCGGADYRHGQHQRRYLIDATAIRMMTAGVICDEDFTTP